MEVCFEYNSVLPTRKEDCRMEVRLTEEVVGCSPL